MDISARLKLIEARKRASSALIEDARAGLVPHVGLAANSLPEPLPREREAPIPTLGDFAEESGPMGSVLRRLLRLPVAAGDVILPAPRVELGDVTAGIGCLLGQESGVPEPCEVVYLDTETTGISGGAGTVAFLVGLAWRPSPGEMHIEQFLMRDFCDEAELIRRVAARIGEFRAIAHYNGKSFDMPVLRSRGIIHRVRPREFRMPEIDLLHPSRRLWRSHLGGASLKAVERGILGLDRGLDIDGEEIPAAFHEFSRGVGHARMAMVVRHNAQDVASLAGVLDLAAAIHGNPMGGAATRLSEHEGMARLLAARGDRDGAADLLDRALVLTTTRTDEERVRAALAAALRRAGRTDRAAAHWRSLLDGSHDVAMQAAIALAKVLEHASRDPEGALSVLRRHIRRLELEADIESMLDRVGPATRRLEAATGDLARRTARLEAKLRRAEARRRP